LSSDGLAAISAVHQVVSGANRVSRTDEEKAKRLAEGGKP